MNRTQPFFLLRPLLICALLIVGTIFAHADLLVSQTAAGKIGKYRLDGSVLNASFITGLSAPTGVLVSGSHLYVANTGNGTIGRYNLDGSASAASFITGLGSPVGLTTDGLSLYVSNSSLGSIGKYDLATGAAVNASLITGLESPQGVLLHQGLLYVADSQADVVRRYAPTGGAAQASLALPAGSNPTALAASGAGNILVATFNTGTIGEYTPSFIAVNGLLASGLGTPSGISPLPGGGFAVVNSSTGTVGTYTATGTPVKASLLSISGAFCIALTGTDTTYPKPTLTVKGAIKRSTEKSEVVLKGTSRNATVVKVTVGTKAAKSAKGTANWTYTAKLKPGANTITIVSKGPGGSSKKVKLTVTRKTT